MKLLGLFALILITQLTIAQETYKNDIYGFKITFPEDYDVVEEDREKMDVISLSSTNGNMVLLTSLFDYKEKIPSSELNWKEVEALGVTADAFNSKFLPKKIKTWKVGDYEGKVNTIKGKVTSKAGNKMKFYGRMYVLCIKDGIEFRITILANSKKNFNEAIATAFVKSFKFFG
ncbi:MAG: hypothetical protein ABJG68_12200 [Crocinitomicaceae bacterium]